MSNLNLSLMVKAQDFASKTIKAVQDNANKSSKSIEAQAKRTATAQQNDIKRTARITQQSYAQIQQAARSREQLGIRSERAIQAEILRSQQAYLRLKNSGVATSRELARAAEAHKRQVMALNAEMGKTSMGQRLGGIGRGVAGVVAGATAGAMVMAQPMKKEMSYDRQLAMTANTAFSERDAAGRIAGKKELHNAVKKAVEMGGGSKEDALGALDSLLASGAVSTQTAINLLPTLQKGAVATGASTADLSKIAISAMQQFGIDESQIGEVLDKAVAAGQAGNFELADMARWLPQQMAAAKSAGLSGMAGFEALLVANQQARVTAGNSDEAGNNLVNLLGKLTSKETNDRFKNLKIKGKDGKEHGIDFIKSMEAQKAQGKDSLQAFMGIVDQVIGEDENYKALQEKLKTAKKEDQKTLLDQMTNLIEGTAIGKIVSDRQALMALLGIRNNVQLGAEVEKSVKNGGGAIETSHAVIASTNDYKVEDAQNNLDFAQMKGIKGFNDALGDTSSKLAQYAKTYPDLTTTLLTAGSVVGALSAAAVVAAGSLKLLSGKAGAGAVGDMLGGIGGGRMGSAAKSTGSLASKGKGLMKLGGRFLSVGGLALTGLMVAAESKDNYFAQQEAVEEKRKPLAEKAYRAMWSDTQRATTFQPTPTGYGKPAEKSSINYHGAYEIAALRQDNAVAKARMEQGTLSPDEFADRVIRNNQRIAEISQPELNQFGAQIQQGLTTALQNQQHTINTHITVELDGRAVAEAVSENQYRQSARE
ncbi:phage tail tape measure protein [[Haemophilus] felis]|uniref:Phage tail tape measure protein n=1 Tax=[Haemophilus] felis TaxID=123822 RepID=A0A1T0BA41_9PAST|nr:phage tail tape measure protein [[Haemophilus] felis]OOS07080.1 phage tail tape measure protein [[Haemophilus] felis]